MLPDLVSSSSSQRVCQNCNDVVSASVPSGLHASRTSTIERIVVEQTMLAIPSHMSRNDSSSQISDLAEYVLVEFHSPIGLILPVAVAPFVVRTSPILGILLIKKPMSNSVWRVVPGLQPTPPDIWCTDSLRKACLLVLNVGFAISRVSPRTNCMA